MPTATPPPPGADPVTGRTLSGWLHAVRSGQDPAAALDEVRAEAQACPALGIWIHLCPVSAWRAQQTLLATRLAENTNRAALLQRYPLLGVPFAVKDNIDIAGEPTTAACPEFAHLAERHATVVQRLLDAGAVWVGKTNLDQFATGLVGTRSPYGRPACVADRARISGGSSSGSAVSVALGLVAFSLGTDTAGSGRVPAGFNGLVGLKPTPGRVSTAGVLPACRTLDCVSIFAHGVDDAAHVLAVIEGADPLDPYSMHVAGPAQLPHTLRIGVPREPRWFGDAGYARAWPAALGHTDVLGHSVVPLDFAPLDAVAELLYDGPWVAERHAVVRELLKTQPEAFDATVRRVISRAIGMSATEAFEAAYRLRDLQASVARLWDEVDVLLVPTAPGHPTFAEVDADPVRCNSQLGTYTNFVNLLGWCALAVPAGQADHGLPFGVTFIGRNGFDAALVSLARRWLLADAPALPLRQPATTPTLLLAVVGAHLSGLPLNRQLLERGATLIEATTTAPAYRLYALPGTVPAKPGLQRVAEGGVPVAVEVWAMPMAAVGSFLAEIPAPLGLGNIELADGRHVHGFLCEAHALAGAADISAHGGWRAYLASSPAPAAVPVPTTPRP
jgi:allophanate hydrolase